MPIPFVLGALGVAAGVLGVGGHLSAKDTNEEAQRVSRNARRLYDSEKESLEKKQEETQKVLLKLGYSKKNTLDNSMKQFLEAYERIKTVSVKSSPGLNEISNFTIEQQDAIQLMQMTDLYSSAASGAVAGAATGAVIALAVSGSLTLAVDALSIAGSALSLGLAGTAAGLVGVAGTSLASGLAFTPLAAVVAPALLFSGFSASSKADENLEKAQAMMEEAKEAVEKMKISETLCDAVAKRAQMYDALLGELEPMFSESVRKLKKILMKKDRAGYKKSFHSNDFSGKELEVIAVTRSLAGAVKAIIDTPILTDDGKLTDESLEVWHNTAEKVPLFQRLYNAADGV